MKKALLKAYFTGNTSDLVKLMGTEKWDSFLSLTKAIKKADLGSPEYKEKLRKLHKIFNEHERELNKAHREETTVSMKIKDDWKDSVEAAFLTGYPDGIATVITEKAEQDTQKYVMRSILKNHDIRWSLDPRSRLKPEDLGVKFRTIEIDGDESGGRVAGLSGALFSYDKLSNKVNENGEPIYLLTTGGKPADPDRARPGEKIVGSFKKEFENAAGANMLSIQLGLALRGIEEEDLYGHYDDEYDVIVVRDEVISIIHKIVNMDSGLAFNFKGFVVIPENVLRKAKAGDKDALVAIRHEKRHNDFRSAQGEADTFSADQRLLNELYAYFSSFVDVHGKDALTEDLQTGLGKGIWAMQVAAVINKDYVDSVYKDTDVNKETLKIMVCTAAWVIDNLIRTYGLNFTLEYLKRTKDLKAIATLIKPYQTFLNTLDHFREQLKFHNKIIFDEEEYNFWVDQFLKFKEEYGISSASQLPADADINGDQPSEAGKIPGYRKKLRDGGGFLRFWPSPEDSSSGKPADNRRALNGEAAASSSINKPTGDKREGVMGGIDFRTLPIVTQAIGNLRMNMDMQAINRLRSSDVSRELGEIQRLIETGISPSAERIKEYVQASSIQDNLDMDKVVSCISDILRHEEETCFQTEPVLRDILVILESSRSSQELKELFICP